MGRAATPQGKLLSWSRSALIALLVTAAVALGFELLLRFVLDYQIDYYTIRTDPGRHELPYGTLLINSFGYPDEEWDLADPRPRVGYLGDSVVLGTGAGYGHRFTDLLAEARPDAQHLTLYGAQHGIHDPDKLVRLAQSLSLSSMIYAMNLDDIMATRTAGGSGRNAGTMQGVFRWARKLEGLRSVSYLFNYSRARIRSVLRSRGYVASGRRDVEFYPDGSDRLIRETAERVNAAASALREHGVEPCVLLLPYEMQISEEAAQRYWEHGIRWGEGFLDRGDQRRLFRYLAPDLDVVDAYYAFVDADSIAHDLADNQLGEFFVYDLGDKFDYSHPTRAGHRRIAEFVQREGFCRSNPTGQPSAQILAAQ